MFQEVCYMAAPGPPLSEWFLFSFMVAMARQSSTPEISIIHSSRTDLTSYMNRYADGENEVFPLLYSLLAPKLRTYLLRLCKHLALADDALQETFLRMHRARGTFGRGEAVLPWAYTIARNVYFDQRRRSHYENIRTHELDAREQAEVLGAHFRASPHDQVSEKETYFFLFKMLENLPTKHREVFELIRFQGLSYAEVAQVVGTTENNVRIRLSRANETLRAALKSHFDPTLFDPKRSPKTDEISLTQGKVSHER